MSYVTERAKLTRTRFDYIEIIMDYCDESFGVAPCTASGTQCYNTFKTCGDTANYNKTTKTYSFINANLPLSLLNDYYGSKPYIKSLTDLATEIKETDTVVKRFKAEFYDELDNDVGIDPYITSRSSIQGTFWKKFLARNPNYKGRLIKQYEGFDGLSAVDFSLKFVGKIENISINRGIVAIEAVDLLSTLKDIEYPLKTDAVLYEDTPRVFEAQSEMSMLGLDAYEDDYCIRRDYLSITDFVNSTATGGSGALVSGLYQVAVVAYGDNAQPFALTLDTETVTAPSNNGYMYIDWVDFADVDYYEIYVKISTGSWYLYTTIDEGIEEVYIYSLTGTSESPPFSQCYRLFLLEGADPSVLGNWTEQGRNITIQIKITTTNISLFSEPGYIKIDDEIIYYTSIVTEPRHYELTNCLFAQVGTQPDWHDAGAIVYIALYYPTPDNPFTILKDILSLAGISASYIDTNFTTLESAWGDIDFATLPILKNKLNEIYFDLVNAVDCISWVGEDGKIKILQHSYTPGSLTTLTEEANFIGESISVDLNEESRYTRWILYWQRKDGDASITDGDSYANLTITIDAVAEGDNEYDDNIEDIQFSTWLSTDNDTPADVTTYVNNLLAARKDRTRNAQPIVYADIELKDTAVATGDLVSVSTSRLQNTDGSNYDAVIFRVVKKQMKGNKASLKMIKVLTQLADELVTQQEAQITTQQDVPIYIES